VVVVVAAVALVAACDGDDGEDPAAVETTPASTVTPTTEVPKDEDGVLRIGLLLPRSGEAATTGQGLIDAAVTAVNAVNEAGGVLGNDVELVTEFDEGANAASARDAIAGLIDADVDAVVGPASSTIALATLGDLLAADILTCSPTATALALDNYPDSELFIRTAPSDSLQAAEIAREAEDTGARSVAVTYVDDPYGRALGAATIAELRSRGIAVDPEVEVPFSPAQDESLADEAQSIGGSDVDAVVVLADGEQGARMLSAIGAATGITPGEAPPDILVNDAIRRPPSPQPIQELADVVREQIVGVSPLAFGTPEREPPGAFATNALDCVNLIALAAVVAESDNAADMRAEIVGISDGGSNCSSFADCAALVDEAFIDYDGPGGRVHLGANGDPVDARWDRFRFDERGVGVSETAAPSDQPV
jgi:branched-chain amino acid transport system substrate-binding protein